MATQHKDIFVSLQLCLSSGKYCAIQKINMGVTGQKVLHDGWWRSTSGFVLGDNQLYCFKDSIIPANTDFFLWPILISHNPNVPTLIENQVALAGIQVIVCGYLGPLSTESMAPSGCLVNSLNNLICTPIVWELSAVVQPPVLQKEKKGVGCGSGFLKFKY